MQRIFKVYSLRIFDFASGIAGVGSVLIGFYILVSYFRILKPLAIPFWPMGTSIHFGGIGLVLGGLGVLLALTLRSFSVCLLCLAMLVWVWLLMTVL